MADFEYYVPTDDDKRFCASLEPFHFSPQERKTVRNYADSIESPFIWSELGQDAIGWILHQEKSGATRYMDEFCERVPLYHDSPKQIADGGALGYLIHTVSRRRHERLRYDVAVEIYERGE